MKKRLERYSQKVAVWQQTGCQEREGGMKYTTFFLWKTTILHHCGVRLLFEYRLHTMREP